MWKASKYVTILLWFLGVVSAIICGYVWLASGNYDPSTQLEELFAIINPLMIWTVGLVIVTALLAVCLPLPALFRNLKSALRLLAAIVGFFAVIGFAYLLSSTEALPFNPGHEPVTDSDLIVSDINIITVVLMLSATILVTIGTSIWNVLKMK